MNIRKLPVGLQDFEDLRTNGYVYVDKTEYLHRLVNFGKPYFLSRPRRFGKSLFLSTLKAYFLGKKEVFEGLAIADLEKDWIEYPVFYIDFNVGIYSDINSLHQALNHNLNSIEKQWGKTTSETNPASRLFLLIQQAFEKTGRKVVVLVDEYDKPLINTIEKSTINSEMRDLLKGFYGVLKSADSYLKFVFLTGVTKFSKVSIFSDLNQLSDISMDKKYAAICGITQAEMEHYLKPEINELAEENGLNYEETLIKLRTMYDGYHFSGKDENIYNPFSLLNSFSTLNFRRYWFATGTPTFLVKMIKDMDFDIHTLEKNVKIPVSSIYDYRVENNDPVPLLYQAGYLTIKSINERLNTCTLGFPNDEVKYGFYDELLPAYRPGKSLITTFNTASFIEYIEDDNAEGFMTHLKAFFADIPNILHNKEEKHYQTIFYILFKLMGQFIQVEVNSSFGRADAIIVTKTAVFAFEFKITERATAEDALQQIDDRGYLVPYISSGKKLVKIGVEFDNSIRGISRWVIG
jgi:hypothetical protein